jgi:hypothetical protein
LLHIVGGAEEGYDRPIREAKKSFRVRHRGRRVGAGGDEYGRNSLTTILAVDPVPSILAHRTGQTIPAAAYWYWIKASVALNDRTLVLTRDSASFSRWSWRSLNRHVDNLSLFLLRSTPVEAVMVVFSTAYK